MSEATVRKVMEAFNRHDASGFASGYASDAIVYDPQYAQPLEGRDSIRDDADAFFKTFPDITGTVGMVIEKDNAAAFEGSFKGTNTGPLKLPTGDLPPTNKAVHLTGAVFVRFNSNGEIQEEHRYFDIAAMMAQLGLGPEGQA